MFNLQVSIIVYLIMQLMQRYIRIFIYLTLHLMQFNITLINIFDLLLNLEIDLYIF